MPAQALAGVGQAWWSCCWQVPRHPLAAIGSSQPKSIPVTLTPPARHPAAALQLDMRTPDLASVPTWQVSADVEALAWDPHNPTQFVVSAEDGVVAAYDARQGANSAPLYQLGAHEKATSCLSFCPAVKGLLATASTDKKVGLGLGGRVGGRLGGRLGGCDVRGVGHGVTGLDLAVAEADTPAASHGASPRPRTHPHPHLPPGAALQVKVWSITENKPALLATQSLNVGAVFSMAYCR